MPQKPPRWNVSQAMVGPLYQNLWRGLVFATIRPEPDLINRAAPTTSTDEGQGFFTANYPVHQRFTPLVAGTQILSYQMLTDPGAGNLNSRMGFYVGDADNEQVGFRFEGAGNDFRLSLRHDSGAFQTLDASISFPYIVRWAVTWDSNAAAPEATTYKDGQQFNTHTIDGTTPFAGSTDWFPASNVPYEYWYVWDRVLTLAELRLMFADPYGLVRPVLRVAGRPWNPPIYTFEEAVTGQVGIPYAMVGGNPDTWRDELGGTDDADLIGSIDEGEPFSDADYAESPA